MSRGIYMEKGPFDFWFKNGLLEFERGDVKIFSMDGNNYLFIGQVLYASTDERPWYIRNVYPHARGKCLEIGLGLGAASKVILANPAVTTLLTLENNLDVISAFGDTFRHHIILNKDVNEWVETAAFAGPIYDFIFVDHFAEMDEEFYPELRDLVDALKLNLKERGKLVVWVDENAAEKDKEAYRKLWVV
jgi:phospholipid N-methyltransferase